VILPNCPPASNVPPENSPSSDAPAGSPAAAAPRLLDRVRDRIRVKHYSLRTEQAYVDWIRRFIRFHGKRHPLTMGAAEVEAFLSNLAVERQVAAPTQNQAKAALLFLYGEVLGVDLPWLDAVVQAKASQRLPVVLTREEVAQLLRRLGGVHRLVCSLLYGAGLRVMEALRLRVKDVDFVRHEILVRDGKGGKDRVTMLPRGTSRPLRAQLLEVRVRHQRDLDDGLGAVWLPHARQTSPSRPRRTRCAIRSRRIFSTPVTTSGQCKNCWATPTSAPR
jgi:integron integrase